MAEETGMHDRSFNDGCADGLKPLRGIDLSKIDSFADLVRAM
jgi:hypothetical protein